MGNLFAGPHIWIVLFIIILLFGAPKLPALARSLGQSMRILKKEVTDKDGEGADAAKSEADASSSEKPSTEKSE